MPEVTERHPRDPVPVWRSSNLVFTIWAVFGGFILHFLLSNYLTVILRPSFEEPVETAGDLVKRNITPFTGPSGVQSWTNLFSSSPNPDYQALSGKIIFAKYCEGCDDCEYCELVKEARTTGKFAQIATFPEYREDPKKWYRSKEPISGYNPFSHTLYNKKWPLKEVLL